MNTPEQAELTEPKTSSRRRLFTTLLGGAAAAVPTLITSGVRAAGATTDTTVPEVQELTTTDYATTDTVPAKDATTDSMPMMMGGAPPMQSKTVSAGAIAPPLQPTAQDKEILNTALGVELAIRDLYADIVATGDLSDEELPVVLLIHSHHVAYAQSLGGLLGRAAINKRNDNTYAEYADKLKGSFKALVFELVTIENGATTRHIESLAMLEGLNGATLIASIISIESRHAASLASVIKKPLNAIIENKQSPIAIGA
ncbi:MAG: hypothetical protein EXQ63_04245 [Ilumatobacteraceae bacterium]|nr:hypothetical protein [Ilumatobacteraceae bacterium]